MKTAMTELIERLKRNIEEMPNEQNSFTQGYKAGLSFVIECATNSLEKEKEQHKETWFRSTAQFDNAAEMTYKKLFDEYYQETYNQNK